MYDLPVTMSHQKILRMVSKIAS